jgi:hypothetical protein
MMAFLLSADNIPFLTALGLMLGLLVLELVFVLAGGDIGIVSDSAEVDLPGDASLGGAHHGIEAGSSLVSQTLGWLHLGKLPLMILLVLALLGFGVTGLSAQVMAHSLFGQGMPWWLACVPALAGMIACLRYAGMLTVRYMPQDETQVVSAESFVGQEAVIVLGTATAGRPAQAKLRDVYGQTHYFMAEPRDEQATLTTGMRILVIGKEGSTYKAIIHPLLSGEISPADSNLPKES